MPTDENNGVNSQNQQVNPNGDQTAQNVGGSDDFDFNFDDSSDNQSDNGLSGDMQDQMRRQGRSGMFLTPDEVITKSNDNIDMSSGQLDLSSTVQPQRRSGMFLTPDEEATKEETQIEGKQYSFQGAPENQAEVTEDSYLAGIDPNDVDVPQNDEEINFGSESQNNYSQDSLDEEIEDLISFGDETKANSESDPLSKPVETSTETSVETPVSESPVEQIVEQNVQPTSEDSQVQDTNSTDNGNVGDSEDWLSQEDKKVEESFGTESGNISPDVDVPPETVSQNVENVINEANNSGVVSQDENVQPVMENDLHIENMGTDVVENGSGDLISDTGGMQQMEQKNTYIPNEAEFNQMSDLLDSSSTGQIDLLNLNSGQGTEQQHQQMQSPVLEQVSPALGTENMQVSDSVDNNNPIVQNNVIQDNMENNVNEGLSNFEGVESQVIPQAVQQEMSQVDQQENSSNVVVNSSNSEINLDSLVTGAEPINQPVVFDNSINSNSNNGSLIGAVNEGTVVEQSNQTVPQKKRKKQSGFKVLGIFAIVCILLGVGIYVANKMFPEEFSKIFNKNDPVVGYLLGNDVTNIDENNPDEENPDNIENSGDVVIENSGDVVEQLDEQPDPDSLAGLLEGDNDGKESELPGDMENTEVNNGNENIEESGDGNETGNNTTGGDNSTGDFDPFAEFGDILEEAQETIEKLNGYVSSGQYYIEWGETNSKPTISTVGRKVVEMAQGELTKLENGGEIDTTAFDRMDELLKKLSDLAK